MTTEEDDAEVVDVERIGAVLDSVQQLIDDHPGGLLVVDLRIGEVVKHVPPTDYEAAVTAALDELDDARLVVRYKAAGVGVVAEVHRTTNGMLWTSVYEVTSARMTHPVIRPTLERLVKDRRRWDRFDATHGHPKTLQPIVELVDHPDCAAAELCYGLGNGAVGSITVNDVLADVQAAGPTKTRTVKLPGQ